MKTIPEKVSLAWNSRKNAIVLTTVDMRGIPNSIYATCVSKYNESTFIIADNYFKKTRENILSGNKASLLFITDEGTSYQIKGNINYYTSGEFFDDMKRWNPANHPGHAAAVLTVEEVYSGSEKLV